jgi:hypothetical protein
MEINEPDWRILREWHPLALERACDNAIAEIERELSAKKPSRERFWAVAELVKRQQKEIANLFDDLRRSTALIMIAKIRHHGLLTDEEMSRFSQETQAKVRQFS